METVSKSGSIAKQLDTLTEEQLQANRSYIKSVGIVVELCGRQGIALVGENGGIVWAKISVGALNQVV